MVNARLDWQSWQANLTVLGLSIAHFSRASLSLKSFARQFRTAGSGLRVGWARSTWTVRLYTSVLPLRSQISAIC
ncbi:hypothetical protein B0H12DRAFT_1142316 [Mycena haematopus]|nr:hypothetical protein B0H12DRAFT_1142316 [Mycena haematopus]